jgi:hypothetical protein
MMCDSIGASIAELAASDEGASSLVFDSYRSLRYPDLLIFVKNDSVPPFRFKSGGWEQLQSSIELGPAMIERIAARGYFMCRVNADRSGWAELTDVFDLSDGAREE